MPTASLTLDNVSPLIRYSGAWRAGSKTPGPLFDEFFDRYSDGGTFAVSNTNGASATISFFGSRIALYGAKRSNHNQFTTVLDGGNPLVGDGKSEQPLFGQTLYQSPILANTAHTVTITVASAVADVAQSFFDLDYVIIDTEVDADAKIQIEDNDTTGWQYGPPSAWNTVPQQLASFSQGSGHSTSTPQATAMLSFTGSAVDVYGLVCTQCGSYWVSVDGADPLSYTAFNADHQKAGSLLFTARGLTEGPHNVTFTNLAASTGNTLALDYAVVHGTNPTVGGASTGTSGSSNGSGPGTDTRAGQNEGVKSTPTGAIVGGVIGGLLIIILGLAFLVFWMRRKRQQEEVAANMARPSMAVAQPWQPPAAPMTAGPYSASVYSRQSPGGAAGVAWNANNGYGSPAQGSGYGAAASYGTAAGAAYYGQQNAYGQQQAYGQQGMYGNGVPTGPPSNHSGSLAYLAGAQSDASGPTGARPMSVSDFSVETPPDYNAATHNGTVVPPMPVRRKN